MKRRLDDVVNRRLLQDTVESASAHSGLRFSVFYPDGQPCVQPRDLGKWFCGQMRDVYPDCLSHCEKSDEELIAKVVESRNRVRDVCWLGLTEIAAPIIVAQEVIGAVLVGGIRTSQTSEESIWETLRGAGVRGKLADVLATTVPEFGDLQLAPLEAFVSALGRLVQGLAEARLQAEERQADLREAADVFKKLLAFAAEVGKQRDLRDVISVIVTGAIEGMNAERGGLTLHDARRSVLTIQEYHPKEVWERSQVEWFPADIQGSLNGYVFRTQQPLAEKDVQTHSFAKPLAPDTHGILLAPLTGRKRLGVIWVESETPGAFGERDRERLSLFAAYAATAIEDAQALKQQEEFMELLTHQMVAPLAAIRRLADRLAERVAGYMEPRLTGPARSIYAQSGIAVNLASKFASIFRLFQDEEPKLKLLPNRLAPLVMGQVALYQYLAHEKELSIKAGSRGLDQLPPVEMDLELMRQVFSVLLDNAIKYSLEGSSIEITGQIPESGWVKVAVFNRGLPITGQDTERIFEYRYRTAAARAAVPVGTGIGLAVAKRIVELHRGRMLMKSVPDGQAHSTWFEIWLPAAPTRRRPS